MKDDKCDQRGRREKKPDPWQNLRDVSLGSTIFKCHQWNDPQAHAIELAATKDVIYLTGPAGTGKTLVAAYIAVLGARNGHFDSIIYTTPLVEVDQERLGFLPGELQEKTDPFFRKFYKHVKECSLPTEGDGMCSIVSPTPLAYMRGETFTRTCAVLDEAQNCTVTQLEMFVTRIGFGSKLIISGDPGQIDRDISIGVLTNTMKEMGREPSVAVVEFEEKHIMRHPQIGAFIKAMGRVKETLRKRRR